MNDSLHEIERVFLAFGDKTRLRLLGLMQHGEVSVNYLCETLHVSQPKVSRHLAYLRTMGMVKTRRDGKWIYYSLLPQNDQRCTTLIQNTLRLIDGNNDAASFLASTRSERSESNTLTEVPPYISDNTDMTPTHNEIEIYLL